MVCKKALSTFLLREILLLFCQRCHDSVHTLRKTWASGPSIWFLCTVPRPGLPSDHLFGATAGLRHSWIQGDVVHQGWHAVRTQSQYWSGGGNAHNHVTVNQVKSQRKKCTAV